MLLAPALAMLLAPAGASAADLIYWADYGRGLVQDGKLGGQGAPVTLYTDNTGPVGIAPDPLTGRLYWSDIPRVPSAGASLRVGNLSGGGKARKLFSHSSQPNGVVVDPALHRMFWADTGLGEIRTADLSPKAKATTLFQGLAEPTGVTIDPASGKIFWADAGDSTRKGTIDVGNLDGTGTPKVLYGDENDASGVALDAATGELYWTDYNSNRIRVGNRYGSRPPETLFTDSHGPMGLAIDPGTGKLYWTDYAIGRLRVANLTGGKPRTLFSALGEPAFLALLRRPVGLKRPRVAGAARVGKPLSCTGAKWAGDLVGSFLYRSAQRLRYAWYRDGKRVALRTGNRLTPSHAGSYRCVAIAQNHAGSATQTSRSRTVSG